jgi:hypothetical protein
LLLAAGQGDRKHPLLAQQADLVQRGADAPIDLRVLQAGDDQRQGDVVEHGAVVQQAVILKDHPDLAAVVRDIAGLELVEVAPVDPDLPACGRSSSPISLSRVLLPAPE